MLFGGFGGTVKTTRNFGPAPSPYLRVVPQGCSAVALKRVRFAPLIPEYLGLFGAILAFLKASLAFSEGKGLVGSNSTKKASVGITPGAIE